MWLRARAALQWRAQNVPCRELRSGTGARLCVAHAGAALWRAPATRTSAEQHSQSKRPLVAHAGRRRSVRYASPSGAPPATAYNRPLRPLLPSRRGSCAAPHLHRMLCCPRLHPQPTLRSATSNTKTNQTPTFSATHLEFGHLVDHAPLRLGVQLHVLSSWRVVEE